MQAIVIRAVVFAFDFDGILFYADSRSVEVSGTDSGERQIPSPESSAEKPDLSLQRPFAQKLYMAG